jgi:hypothetical protein
MRQVPIQLLQDVIPTLVRRSRPNLHRIPVHLRQLHHSLKRWHLLTRSPGQIHL